ncbi:hypothetical protein BV22DRAFT_1048845 [Leucogyrophana mollusca]|uniref:Uncharacterized protein n=1 Tax=Leucogyrophana mollusca TaxID=85980 RepID=A0ACB8BB77_9AGAM|nr:hypothetical protein BV22DRAFT_1048845 [Leucogyrophana mollusca]
MSTSSNPIESSAVRRASRRLTKGFNGRTERVNSVAYFLDGQQIASAPNDKTVVIWDAGSGGEKYPQNCECDREVGGRLGYTEVGSDVGSQLPVGQWDGGTVVGRGH